LSDACPSVEFDHAVIEIIANAGFCEERLRRRAASHGRRVKMVGS
jgi:hypothetical protein